MIKMEKIKQTKAITLIALVITIIILLILAGVSIAMLTGNNGILTQAKLAKENTAAAEKKEKQELEELNSYMNEKTIKDNYTDVNGDKATIPDGFTIEETENTIKNGLVVHGPDKANGDNGSEFVWIPVSDINLMAQCSTAGGNCNIQLENGILKCKTHNNKEIVGKLYSVSTGNNYIEDNANSGYNINSGLREPAMVTGNDEGTGADYDNNSAYNDKLFTNESMKADYKKMATSVAKYGGFYVGRYETSLSNSNSTEAKDGNAQSKSGVIPTSANNSATYRWYGLYQAQKTYADGNSSVESSMIWGSQYDAIINWVKNGNNETEKAKLTNQMLGNNSSNSVTTTGNVAYKEDSINNIRDLGGNLFEWTLEAYENSKRTYRGGSSNYNFSPSCRYSINSAYTDGDYGSRLTLYIK